MRPIYLRKYIHTVTMPLNLNDNNKKERKKEATAANVSSLVRNPEDLATRMLVAPRKLHWRML